MSEDQDQITRIQTLVREAAAIPPEQLEAWLATQKDPSEVLEAVREVLTSSSKETAYLKTFPTLAMDTADSPLSRGVPPGGFEPDPLTIGPYAIKRRLGEGGFGVVYLAHQEAPIRRDVAIKVVRSGLGGSNVLIRFEAERQALAMMSHPALASVIDAGSTASGCLLYTSPSPRDS